MPRCPSLPDPAHPAEPFARFPGNVRRLMDDTDGFLPGNGAWRAGKREAIAAHVPALGAGTFCAGAHRAYAEMFGLEAAPIVDVDRPPVDAQLRAMRACAAKFNTLPSKRVDRDAQAVDEAGWSEAALYAAVQIRAKSRMMTRIVEGAGAAFEHADPPGDHPASGSIAAARATSHSRFGDRIDAMTKG